MTKKAIRKSNGNGLKASINKTEKIKPAPGSRTFTPKQLEIYRISEQLFNADIQPMDNLTRYEQERFRSLAKMYSNQFAEYYNQIITESGTEKELQEAYEKAKAIPSIDQIAEEANNYVADTLTIVDQYLAFTQEDHAHDAVLSKVSRLAYPMGTTHSDAEDLSYLLEKIMSFLFLPAIAEKFFEAHESFKPADVRQSLSDMVDFLKEISEESKSRAFMEVERYHIDVHGYRYELQQLNWIRRDYAKRLFMAEQERLYDQQHEIK